MIKDWKVIISTGPFDKDYLVAEISYKGEDWAELTEFGDVLKIYSKRDKQPWKLNPEEVIQVIKMAEEALKGRKE